MYPIDFESWWGDLQGITNADIEAYAADYGLTPEKPSDPKALADAAAAKDAAVKTGNTKLANTLDFFLKYGDKTLSILSKNGIIKNANTLSLSDYSAATLAGLGVNTTDNTSNAPIASARVFNLDFTDPKTLIIIFLVVMGLAYFLFFKSDKKNGKR